MRLGSGSESSWERKPCRLTDPGGIVWASKASESSWEILVEIILTALIAESAIRPDDMEFALPSHHQTGRSHGVRHERPQRA